MGVSELRFMATAARFVNGHRAKRGRLLSEGLSRLYQELDYPDDARVAQRVARQLVDAFPRSSRE